MESYGGVGWWDCEGWKGSKGLNVGTVRGWMLGLLGVGVSEWVLVRGRTLLHDRGWGKRG